MLGLAPEVIAATSQALLLKAKSIDPMGQFNELIRQAHPGTWASLRGDALLAMDYRIAAEILLRALDDLGRGDLSARPPRGNRMFESVLDERLQAEPERLDEMLANRGLSPCPAVLLVLEVDTEMLLMPRVLAEIYGKSVPSTPIELVNMKTIDQKLDLFVRHEAGPRLGDNLTEDAVVLTRPSPRILVAVDPEKKYADRASVRGQRDMLVRRLHEVLPAGMRSATTMRQLRPLVDIVTWGTVPWEFANFTDTELAEAIMRCSTPPGGITRRDLVTALAAERNIRDTNARRSPDVEAVCRSWASECQVQQDRTRRAAVAGPAGEGASGYILGQAAARACGKSRSQSPHHGFRASSPQFCTHGPVEVSIRLPLLTRRAHRWTALPRLRRPVPRLHCRTWGVRTIHCLSEVPR